MWYVRVDNSKTQQLAVIRDKGGFAVVGSPTGNYLSGHGETVAAKHADLLSEGFLPLAEASERGLLPPDWRPLVLTQADYDFLELMSISVPPEHQDPGYRRPNSVAARLRVALRRLFGRE